MSKKCMMGEQALKLLVQKAVRWLPISSCYQCKNRDTIKCLCLLTDRKRNKHPPPWENIPSWCPLPKEVNIES